MTEQERNEGIVDSTARTAKNAIRLGKETASTARTLSKAAGKAATGNFAGAALDVLKDPKTARRVIAIIMIPVIFFMIIMVMFLYALPTAIFEALDSYFAALGEQWKADTYGGTHAVLLDAVAATIKAGASIVTDAARGLWNGIKALFKDSAGYDKGSVEDILSSDGSELAVTAVEQAELDTLLRKLDTCTNKVTRRQEQVKDAIIGQKKSLRSALYQARGTAYDEFYLNLTVTVTPLPKYSAVQMLSLYTVQKGGNLNDVKISDLAQWFGWQSTLSGRTRFTISDFGVTCAVHTWSGRFMPEYLVEQRKQELDKNGAELTDFDAYGCAATDLMILINAPDMADVPISTRTETRSSTYIDPETGEEETDSYTVVIATATMNVTVGTRPADALVDMTGLWDGALSQAQMQLAG